MINCNLPCDSCTRQTLVASKSREKLEKLQQMAVSRGGVCSGGVTTTPLLVPKHVTTVSSVALGFVEAGTASTGSKKGCRPVSLSSWAGASGWGKVQPPLGKGTSLQMFSWAPGCSAAMGSLWDHINNKAEVPHASLFQWCYQTQLGHWTGAPLT